MRPLGILETCLYAKNLSEIETFYTGAMGLVRVASEPGRYVFFRCGAGVLLVFDPRHTRVQPPAGGVSLPPHGAEGPGHLAFAAEESDLPAWRERLERAGVAIEAEVHWPHGGRSIYFRDPAGNSIEIATPAIWGL